MTTQLIEDLSLAHNIIAQLNLDDLTYTHASIRYGDGFYIGGFGYFFEEMTPDKIIKLNYNGEIIEGKEKYNRTGFAIHGNCYKKNSLIQAIIHIHTIEIIAISATKLGLLPISQHYCMTHGNVKYLKYDGLILESKNDTSLAEQIDNTTEVVMLENHGALIFGETIQAAILKTIFLQKACQIQIAAEKNSTNLNLISPEICQTTRDQMRNFEPNLGMRDWIAFKRILSNNKHS